MGELDGLLNAVEQAVVAAVDGLGGLDILVNNAGIGGARRDEYMAVLAADPDSQRWLQLTDQSQQPVDTAVDAEWRAAMEEGAHHD